MAQPPADRGGPSAHPGGAEAPPGPDTRAATRLSRLDVLIATGLWLVVLVGVFGLAHLPSPALFLYRDEFDVWFQSDLSRVFSNMTDLASSHFRSTVHPVFSLLGFGLFTVTRLVTGLPLVSAARLTVAGVAAFWLVALFLVMRLVGCRRTDALLFSGLAASSAAFLFWTVVPETYVFGAASIMPMLILVTLAPSWHVPRWMFIGASALSLTITVTNWMTGIVGVFAALSRRTALAVSAAAFLVVLALSTVQNAIMANVGFMLNWAHEARFAFPHQARNLWRVPSSMIFHSILMPAIDVVPREGRTGFDLITQQALPGSAGWLGVVGVCLWAALLGIGLYALVTLRSHRALRITLLLTLLAQLALHLVYGSETFLYAMHWVGSLVLVAALGCLTRTRRTALLLASGLLICASVNNAHRLSEAAGSLSRYGSPRQLTRVEMHRRPEDPWPRGTGHVVLAWPGSDVEAKAYHEPGGSFSPGVDSFGVALWVLGADGHVRRTSDDVPLVDVHQRFLRSEVSGIPGIESRTPQYTARWTTPRAGHWRLDVEAGAAANEPLAVVVRSVGPAGGPVRHLRWDGERLTINDGWTVSVSPAPRAVQLGQEGTPGWTSSQPSTNRWDGSAGWGYARIELDRREPSRLVFARTVDTSAASSDRRVGPSGLDVDLPDQRFAASIEAQVAHLAMGTVATEIRPGDPQNYPAPWLRDTAHVVAALARSGQTELAGSLTSRLAERDFFGGFGSEADGPGLAIWALTEVGTRLHDTAYDRRMWPHIQRKARLIEAMLAAAGPLRQTAEGPALPELGMSPSLSLVAARARDGLIVGRVEMEFPLLYVNAVSYRGLIDAAALADRLDERADAHRWRALAAQLAVSWNASLVRVASESAWQARAADLIRAARLAVDFQRLADGWRAHGEVVREELRRGFRQPLELGNDQTFVASAWPSGIVGRSSVPFRGALERRWRQARDDHGDFLLPPVHPALALAEAHQWLALGAPDRAWATVRWFLDHEASPGLYTWWDGVGDQHTFFRWDVIRGWVNPPHLTPAYRASAEMLSLQLDMLARLDADVTPPTVVIGPGIPTPWIGRSMHARGIPLGRGHVSWEWDGRAMRVVLTGMAVTVRLGPAFPPSAPITVERRPSP